MQEEFLRRVELDRFSSVAFKEATHKSEDSEEEDDLLFDVDDGDTNDRMLCLKIMQDHHQLLHDLGLSKLIFLRRCPNSPGNCLLNAGQYKKNVQVRVKQIINKKQIKGAI
ncbi:hypothetical protein CIHG_05560 [Coccidioides immitis H538.4]|uniref:Uncharacterized protein n=1 Tax=Coccidioides immitis H538.4 TaxID=396776 RepID=A0A0J8RT90_COCIT|nr:hypothetical protein CIHG_05560 [Coccidioides immitis H538.4]